IGKHYHADTEGGALGFIKAMYKSARWCQRVEPSETAEGEGRGVFFFRNKNGLSKAPATL
ncbi:hypothetical protein P154DRAFT_417047, partial [Amniculicola lignicola CBS 123094]